MKAEEPATNSASGLPGNRQEPRQQARRLSWLTGPSIRARLLRTFLPATLLIVLLNDLLSHLLPGAAGDGVLAEGMQVLVSLLIMGVLVFLLSRWVGQNLEEAESDRRQAAGALRESEERYRALAEAAQDMIFIVGRDDRVEYVNQCTALRFGCRPEDLIGKPRATLFPPAVAVPQGESLQNVFSSGQPYYAERLTPLRGGNMWLGTWLAPIHDATGHVRAVLGISRDITQRKQAEEALQLSQARLRLEMERAQGYLDVAGVVLMVLDNAGRVTLLNKRGQELLGYREAELVGLNWFESCLPERLRADVQRAFAELMSGHLEVVEYFENPVLTRSGEERLMAWHNALLRDSGGQIIGTLSSGEDITARRRTEQELQAAHDQLEARVRDRTAELEQRNQELRSSEERFRTLFEAAPFAISLHAPDGRFLQANRAHQALTGYTREELQQLSVHQLVLPGHYPVLHQAFQAVIEGRLSDHRQELSFQTKDGRVRWAAVATAALRGAGGQLFGLLSLVDDITERKEASDRSVAFARLGHLLSAALTPVEAARIVFDVADSLLGWDASFLHLVSNRGEIDHVLTLDTVDGRRVEVSPRTFVSLEPSPFMLDVMDKGPRLVNRRSETAAGVELVPFGDTKRRSASLMFVPIRHGPDAIGVLSIQSYTPNAYSAESLGLLQSLADHCAGALERIRAASALEEQERNHRALLDAIPDALLRLREDGLILDARRGDSVSLGVFTEAAGKKIQDLVEPALAEQILAHAVRALQSGRHALFGMTPAHFPSKPVALDVRVVPIRAQEVLVMLRDVTASRRTEQALTEAVAREQRRIGYELHDGLGQHLAGMALKAKILQEILQEAATPGIPQATELVQLAKDALDQTRRLARGLEPVEVEMGDLVLALDRLARESAERFRANCVWECALAHLPVSPSTGFHLYRIAQEAIRNAIQHGRAGSVLVHLARLEDGALALAVRDDGSGFDLTGIGQPGLGLQIMHYRATLIGASLSIESAPGKGAEIRCVIPDFQHHQQREASA